MSADWAQVWLGIAGLLGLALTVHFARNAWKEAQATNKQTRDQFAAERRPWCSVEPSGPSVHFEGRDAVCQAEIVVTNVGQSPALWVEFFPLSWTAKADEKDLAAAIDRARTDPLPAGMTIFPGQTYNYPVSWTYNNATDQYGPKLSFLQGWVSYSVAGDTRRHFTPFIVMYQFDVNEGASLGGARAVPFRLSLSAD